MHRWYRSDESELTLWAFDLDDALYSVHHRRLCVWPDAFDGIWHWEIQTYDDDGAAAGGTAADQAEAMAAAEEAARRLGGL